MEMQPHPFLQVIVCAACCGAKGFGAFIVPCPPRWSGDPGNLRQKIWEEDLVDMLSLPKNQRMSLLKRVLKTIGNTNLNPTIDFQWTFVGFSGV